MEIKRFEGNGRMSQVVKHGDTLYLSGVVSHCGGDFEAQAEDILAKIETTLEKYGSTRNHILSATIYIINMNKFDDFNKIWDAWIADGHEPARTCIVTDFSTEGILVEITITAVLK